MCFVFKRTRHIYPIISVAEKLIFTSTKGYFSPDLSFGNTLAADEKPSS